MEYGLRYIPGSNYDIYGYVRYIHPNSNAQENNIQRGDIFNAINGISLTVDNYSELLANDIYTVNFAEYLDQNTSETSDDQIISNDIDIELTKVSYEKNPIHISSIIETQNQKIGYLKYNRFIGDYDNELINVFNDGPYCSQYPGLMITTDLPGITVTDGFETTEEDGEAFDTMIDLDRDMPEFEGTMDALEDLVDSVVGEPEFLGGR